MKRNDAELRLQCAVVQHLRLRCPRDVFFAAIPNGEHRSKKTGARLKAMGVIAGAPDLLIIANGIVHGLELKAEGGRQSAAQRAVEDRWRAAGGIYAVTTGIDETLATLVAWGALPHEYMNRPRPQQLPFTGDIGA